MIEGVFEHARRLYDLRFEEADIPVYHPDVKAFREIRTMQRVCLAVLRFCLCAWVGIAIFFVMVVINLRQSELFADEEVKDNHPKVLFPLYYGFEFSLLGTALVCATSGLGNARIARRRRYAALLIILAAVAVAGWDYENVYQPLVEVMATKPRPPSFRSLHRLSESLNSAVLGLTLLAAAVALWPETLKDPP